jgi:hypothetical protein
VRVNLGNGSKFYNRLSSVDEFAPGQAYVVPGHGPLTVIDVLQGGDNKYRIVCSANGDSAPIILNRTALPPTLEKSAPLQGWRELQAHWLGTCLNCLIAELICC